MHAKIPVLFASIVLAISVGLFSYGAKEITSRQKQIQATVAVRGFKSLLLMNLLDAETGQRGFMIIPRSDYLEPYTHALVEVPKLIASIEETAVTDRQRDFIRNVKPMIARKLAEMGETIAIRRTNSLDQAVVIIATDEGQHIMTEIRSRFLENRRVELDDLKATMDANEDLTTWMIYDILVMLIMLVTVTIMLRGTKEKIVYRDKEIIRYYDELEPNARLDEVIDRFRGMIP